MVRNKKKGIRARLISENIKYDKANNFIFNEYIFFLFHIYLNQNMAYTVYYFNYYLKLINY